MNVLECRKCGSENVCVWDSRKKEGTVIRRRKCTDCGKRWMTIEVEYWEWMQQKAGDNDC